MQNGLNADLAFDENCGRLGGHPRLCTRAVRDIYAIDAGIFEQSDRVESFFGVAAFRRQDLD